MTALLTWLVAQTPPSGSPSIDWGSLLGGVLGGSPAAMVLAWRLHKEDSENERLHTEVREGQDKLLALVERTVPALADATRTLADVKAAMENVRGTSAPSELTRALFQIEEATRELRRQKGGP